MESATEDKRPGGGVSAELSAGETEHSEGQDTPDSTHTQDEHTGSNGALEEGEEEEEEEEDENGENMTEEGVDLSSINAMISTVMNAGQLNGAMEPSSAPASTPSIPISKTTPPRPPSFNRNARRNTETKDVNTDFICPLCEKDCMTQHQLTMHIRQHNSDNGATDHSCSICGKALSSASSLDRHMLVHSGERPYKCSFCGQTFTTNGNMHRHMKIHDKDPAGVVPISPPSPTKRRRPSAKRRSAMDEDMERGDEPPNKKVLEESVLEELGSGQGDDEVLPCPICFKTFGCKYDLEVHMDTHPDTTLRCDLCCLSFRTHRGLLRHNAGIHKKLPTDSGGRPFIQTNPSIPSGFNDLAFIDFSCRKFSHIAQVWCETNLRRCTSKFHRFVCEACDKAFPLRSALDLHKTTIHQQEPPSPVGGGQETPVVQEKPTTPTPQQASFLESLGLQHISQVKPQPSEDEVRQAQLDSIRVIQVEPPDSTLPQEAASTAAGFLGGLGLVPASSLQGLSQREALSLLSLQPFPTGFLFQPDGDTAVKPVCGEHGLIKLADIQQILKVASAVPGQMGLLPPLAKAPHWGVSGQGQAAGCKPMPPLKPKPMVAPRSSLAASTPPPLQNTQQASLGCISPSLPPPPSQLLKMPRESSSSSSSSSSSGSQASLEKMQMEADCMGDAHMPNDLTELQIKQEEGQAAGGKKGAGGANRGGAKASYPCRFCDQVFAFSGVLQAHMRFHLGILPHQCNICDYVAPDKATLIRHLRTHSGERPYVCRVCHYPFTVKANCERHLRKKHMKNTRKDIEKNIKYVSSTTTQDPLELAAAGDTACRFCGEDLKSYRALQIHLRTHNGCQRKPFECRRCGAAFLAKRNCIHHMLKQHPEVQEREIEEHIATLLPAITATTSRASPSSPLALNGLTPTPTATLKPVKVEDLSIYSSSGDLDQPLDFSNKSRGGSGTSSTAGSLTGSPGIKLETVSPAAYDCSMEPIDLSIPKNPSKSLKRDTIAVAPVSVERREIKKELPFPSVLDHLALPQALQLDKSTEEKLTTPQSGSYQLPPVIPSPLPIGTPTATGRALRLKPLLPKPAFTSSSSSLKELPPLASIAQIISSVSGAPDLLKREPDNKAPAALNGLQTEPERPAGGDNSSEASMEELLEGSSRKRTRKKQVSQAKTMAPARVPTPEQNTGSGLDLESSGEFASVEKMLATTDANKFSTYLQTGAAELGRRDEGRQSPGEEKEEKESPPQSVPPQSKGGKKNAYSNSVQKMTCPFCPRVFPWASSLQRHMLTHTGQKPFPCPKCDAFFSTKSNCERHLLRKHGVTNRSLRRNGQVSKNGDEGSHDSAESSENEQTAGEVLDLSSMDPDQKGDAYGSSSADQTPDTAEQLLGEMEPQPSNNNNNVENEDYDDNDSQSNKSLDLNFASKLIDFKFSSEGEQPQTSLGGESVVVAEPERVTDVQQQQQDQESSKYTKYTCKSCKKNFRYAATLARHEKAHLCESAPPEEACGTEGTRPGTEELPNATTATAEEEDQEEEEEEGEKEAPESEGAGSVMDSGSEEEEKEKEERSDEEGGLAEPKNGEGEVGRGSGSKADKRKKICNVCSKRFWSLQDLTRHMRSHTGERPYKCQTCERTFTLKHSLVRHQRIHLKPRGSDGADANGAEAPAGDSASEEGECTPTSTCPPSENESEGTGAAREEGAEKEAPLPGSTSPDQSLSTTEPAQSESATEAVAELLTEPASEPVSEPVLEPVPDPSVEQASDSVSEIAVELSAAESASETASNAATQPVTETPKESSTESPTPQPSAVTPELDSKGPSEGFIQGLLEIHTKPSLEYILPAGEARLVGVE